ncbi:MAG: DUF3363 domain-containing protein [Brevundimonas sp.]|uniref:DUF3363 domain-containing protein n=1 Tax=Brevundimonas sp. TaxID=1871086 RepID=UPI00391D5775
MLVGDAIRSRLESLPAVEPAEGPLARLPDRLKSDRTGVRTAMMMRLAASRLFALGDRKGCLSAAAKRSGRGFRLDVRQRVIVKALVSRHSGKGGQRGAALAKHLLYLGRDGAGEEESRAVFFDAGGDRVDPRAETAGWSRDRHHFRFIVSPEHGDRITDLRGYVRDVMQRVGADLGEPELRWLATCHYDTDQPHAHVLVRGRRGDGRDLVIPRDYIAYGFRARAQEAAQERLGDLSRGDAERRVWRETQADRFTGLDRRLLAARDEHGLVPDGVGVGDSWAALTRGRLRHLEALGLAERHGRGYRLADGLEGTLRGLQLRSDIIRTMNQRRLEAGRAVRTLGQDRVRGTVVKTGFHDEAGASPWVIVREASGDEVFARLGTGAALPRVGQAAELDLGARGAALVRLGRDAGLSR